MKIPRIIYSNWRLNLISWFFKVGGFTFFPWIVLREHYRDDPRYAERNKITTNHESIHIEQQKEMLVLPFYIWYLIEWFFRLFLPGNAYRNISFEREAYANQLNINYINSRKFWAFLKYL
jgi:hypothetical protein